MDRQFEQERGEAGVATDVVRQARQIIDDRLDTVQRGRTKIARWESKADSKRQEVEDTENEIAATRLHAADRVQLVADDFLVQRGAIDAIYNDDPSGVARNDKAYLSASGLYGKDLFAAVGSVIAKGIDTHSFSSSGNPVAFFGSVGNPEVIINYDFPENSPKVVLGVSRGAIFGPYSGALDANHGNILPDIGYDVTAPIFADPADLHRFLNDSIHSAPTFATYGKDATTELISRVYQDLATFQEIFPTANFNAADLLVTASRLNVPIGDMAKGDPTILRKYASEQAAVSVANRIGILISSTTYGDPSISFTDPFKRRQLLEKADLPVLARPGKEIVQSENFNADLTNAIAEQLVDLSEIGKIVLRSIDNSSILDLDLKRRGISPGVAADVIEMELDQLISTGLKDPYSVLKESFTDEVLKAFLKDALESHVTKRSSRKKVNYQSSKIDRSPVEVRNSLVFCNG